MPREEWFPPLCVIVKNSGIHRRPYNKSAHKSEYYLCAFFFKKPGINMPGMAKRVRASLILVHRKEAGPFRRAVIENLQLTHKTPL